VVLDDGSASSSVQSSGSYTHQFSTAGTYSYHCAVHGTAMSGKIVVQ
jgi:plastocyanin